MDQTLNIMQVKLFQFAKCTFSLLVIASLASGDPPDSPCPVLFQYKFDGSDWIGLIELNSIKVNQTVVNIIVELSLPTSLPSPYKGRLDLLEEQQQAFQAVFESRPLFYRINFPLKNPIPRVTQITVDNNVLCSGPADQSPQMTRFQLHHVFYPKRPTLPSIIKETSNEGRPCELTDGMAGVCTIINKCKAVYQGSIKYEELAKNRCDFVDGTDFVCCKDPDLPTGRRADEACAKYNTESAVNLLFFRADVAVTYGEFPHMAILGYSSSEVGEYIWKCPASLISDQFLLTSAHCVMGHKPSRARLGYVLIRPNKTVAATDSLIDELLIHPNYRDDSLYHDVALVRLNQKVEFTEILQPACLDTKQTFLPPETNIVLLKWYTNYFKYESGSLELTKKYLNIAEFSSCNQSYVKNRKLPNGLTEGQMCAFDPQVIEGCKEDTDGLLQIFDNIGKPTIYGVTNFLGGCESSLPGVYTRFSNYIEWIESIVWPYTPK